MWAREDRNSAADIASSEQGLMEAVAEKAEQIGRSFPENGVETVRV